MRLPGREVTEGRYGGGAVNDGASRRQGRVQR